MKSFQEIYTELQDATGDDSSGQLTIFKRHVNDTQRIVASKAPFLTLETTATKATVASQEGYQISNSINKIRSLYVTLTGGTIYRPDPVEDPTFWEYLKSLEASDDDAVRYYMRQGNQILLWPEPTVATSTITIRGRKKLKDLSLADYTTGTITSVTNGDETVTGSSTSWVAGTIGNWIRIDYTTGDFQWYEISSITSTTVLELLKPYEGTTISAATETYTIGEFSEVPEDYDSLLFYRPMALYHMSQRDMIEADKWWRLYDGGKEAGLATSTGGLLKQMLSEELQRNESLYTQPLPSKELNIQDLAIPDGTDISIEP